ncbi:metal ABC transporter permease [Lachnoanaerobaculum orale]|uniref:metal ABC transporter permease n=1 Tax=Lachnoanaerobaculum orale TaxID=979627 RepID=UPI0023A7A209|nr:iron chelate uptake ABC transporter family permease subunit [Lachnoanaerobaculum orale]
MNISIITQYSFIVVAIGTMLLAMATGIVGTISILKGQSLIGDAVGHASLPGIILAFMISGRKSAVILMLGAIVAGIVAFMLIQIISEGSKIEADTAMAVILSAMFGMGMVLKSYIQGNPKYQSASQSGLASYIFGQAAYILREDVYIILAVSVISLALFIVFYKEIKVYVFDMVYAYTIGINSRLTSLLIMIITMILIAAGLKAVGAILISSMLITPAVTGLQWSKSYEKVLVIAAVTGAVSAFLGTFISSAVKGFSTGPSIILIMSVIALFSVLFAPRGIVRMLLNIRKMRVGK